ncbi:hypothetical protein [Marinoscillum sp.]|uniref:hypothetical protein n=1 Tax=Marinoscillum sp. TaxID=2024838 RepID=UPI003BACC0E5
METLTINHDFELGEELLRSARKQIRHDHEIVRSQARQASSKFLISYLDHYGVEPFTEDPVVLLNQCREINSRFYALELPAFAEYDEVNLEILCVAAERVRDFVAGLLD